MIQYVYNSIELNIQRMTIYKNISLGNIRKKKKNKEKTKENKYFWRCVLVL